MKKFLSVFLLFLLMKVGAQQIYSGQVFMRENSEIWLNQIYVTNITEQKTVISTPNGEFKIYAKPGDVIRFSSIITERKDIKLTDESFSNKLNFIQLKPSYFNIEEVIVGWKPSGHLPKDVLSLRKAEKSLEIAKMIGLPEPKGDGTSPVQPVASLADGGLSFSIESIYDIISGDRKKKERLNELERMMTGIEAIKNYFGTDYFEKVKIPQNLTLNFLQFVYTSDNIRPYLEARDYEATKPYIEKYLPIYQKRLRDSKLQQSSEN